MEFDCTYPMPPLLPLPLPPATTATNDADATNDTDTAAAGEGAGLLTVGKHQDTALEVGEHRLRRGKTGPGSGVPRPVRGCSHGVLRLLDIQESLGVEEELRTEWGPVGLV